MGIRFRVKFNRPTLSLEQHARKGRAPTIHFFSLWESCIIPTKGWATRPDDSRKYVADEINSASPRSG